MHSVGWWPWAKRVGSVTALCLMAATLLSGCIRAQATMTVSNDHHVSGSVIAAEVPENSKDKGPQLAVPDDLRSLVSTQPYNADGYVGSKLNFQDLDFDQFSELVSGTGQDRRNFDLSFRTAGNLVSFSGAVDLTAVPTDRADVQVKINFAGEVLTTTGSSNGNTITWKLKPGEVTQMSATVDVSGSSTPVWLRWAVLLGGILAIVVILVVILAIAAHRRSLRIYRR